MSTIAGHALAAVCVYEAVRRPCGLAAGWPARMGAAALGVAPDLDVLLAMVWPGMIGHRGFTHSLLFALMLAALATPLLAGKAGGRRLAGWLGLVLVCAVHPVLDYLMACGPAVPFFWPISKAAYLSPVQWAPTAYYSSSWQGLLGLFTHGPTLKAFALELVIFLPPTLLAARGPKRWGWLRSALLLLVSAGGVGATLYLYGGWDRLAGGL